MTDFVGDIMSDVVTDPFGRFVVAVLSSTGQLAVVTEDESLRPRFTVDLQSGPLLKAYLSHRGPSAGPALFVTAPAQNHVLHIDMNALTRMPEETDSNIVLDCFGLVRNSGCRLSVSGDQIEGTPGEVVYEPNRGLLFVAHADAPVVTVFDLLGGAVLTQFELSSSRECKDGYLTSVYPTDSDPTCDDGFDNDEDGLTDGADPDCANKFSEAPDALCPQVVECFDGIDNDDDGQIDAMDDDCLDDARWERATPLCDDSLDNDGDGLIDVWIGCMNELDASELDRELEGLCENGLDDDADGLVDLEDPGCLDPEGAASRYAAERVPECGDTVDNDGDGRIDFGPAGDPDCYAAGDISEGQSALTLGPIALEIMAAPRGDVVADSFVYIVDGGGALHVAWPNPEGAFSVKRASFDQDVQAQAPRISQTEASLLVIASDNSLRQLSPVVKRPVQTDDGRDVYLQTYAIDGDALATSRLTADQYVAAAELYAVVDGAAYAVLDGFSACAPKACTEGGGECLNDGESCMTVFVCPMHVEVTPIGPGAICYGSAAGKLH